MENNNSKKNIPQSSMMNLADSKVLKHYQDYVKYLTTFDLLSEANDLRKALPVILEQNPNLAKTHPSSYEQYEKILVLLRFVVLPFLADKEAVSLVEENLADALDEPDIVLGDKIKAKILTVAFEERDVFKRELREAMLRNNQRLTAKNITLEGKAQPPSVGNWIKDYNGIVGAEVASQIEKVEYLVNSANTKALSENDKKKVEILVDIYENLKKTSSDLEGIEEAVPYYYEDKHFVLTKGKLEQVKPDKVLLSILKNKPVEEVEKELAQKEKEEAKEELELAEKEPAESAEAPDLSVVEKEVLSAYHGDPQEQKAIALEEEKLNNFVKEDNTKLRTEFLKAVQRKNINQAVAALRLLAQRNDLPNFIRTDGRLNKFLSTVWAKQYGPKFVEEFSADPAQVKFIRLFLRYVLEERLEIVTNDAARIGLQIGSIFAGLGRKDYNKMAFFDVKDKSFKWFED